MLVPTRELAAQVTEEFEYVSAGRLRIASVYGGVPLKPQAESRRRRTSSSRRPAGCRTSSTASSSRSPTSASSILDEADRMLDMGFKPQVDRIVRLLSDDRQTMFFSATLDGEVGELARRYTHMPARFEGELPEGSQSGEVAHRFVAVTSDTKVKTLVDLLNERRARTRARSSCAPRPVPTGSSRNSRAPRRRRGRDSRRQGTGSARAGARPVRCGPGSHSRRHRRRRPRARCREITHVINFDPPERRRLHPPRRPHRTGRPWRHRDHARTARAAGRRQPRRTPERAGRGLRVDRHEGGPAAARLYVAPRPGSKW